MSSKTLKFNSVPAAAALVVALGYASPLWAQAPTPHSAPPNLRLAMMDMDDMPKMKKKDGMGAMPSVDRCQTPTPAALRTPCPCRRAPT